MKKETLSQIITAILMVLFFYAATSKLMDYEHSKQEMFKQIFPGSVGVVLVWAVPVVELLAVGLLSLKDTRLKGLYAALFLLSVFTLYIAIAMSGVFGHRPCSCGGILKNMGYWTHLVFNLFFIVLTVIGIALEKERGSVHIWFHSVNRKEGTGVN